MPFEVNCPKGHRLQVTEAHMGKQVRCPTCGETFVAAAETKPAAPAAPVVATSAAAPATPAIDTSQQPPDLPQVQTAGPAWKAKLSTNIPKFDIFSHTSGRWLLMAGLLMVLASRGCDSIGSRGVDRLEGKAELVVTRFNDKWDEKRILIQADIDEIDEDIEKEQDGDDPSDKKIEGLRDDRSELRDKLSDLSKDKSEAEAKLRRGDWRDRGIAARDAAAGNNINAYWRAWVFVIGSIVLTFGLLVTGWSAEGAERTICLVMLAIVTYSIYIGGSAWTGADGAGGMPEELLRRMR